MFLHRLSGRCIVVANGLDRHAVLDEMANQVGRSLRMGDGELQRLVVLWIVAMNRQ